MTGEKFFQRKLIVEVGLIPARVIARLIMCLFLSELSGSAPIDR